MQIIWDLQDRDALCIKNGALSSFSQLESQFRIIVGDLLNGLMLIH